LFDYFFGDKYTYFSLGLDYKGKTRLEFYLAAKNYGILWPRSDLNLSTRHNQKEIPAYGVSERDQQAQHTKIKPGLGYYRVQIYSMLFTNQEKK